LISIGGKILGSGRINPWATFVRGFIFISIVCGNLNSYPCFSIYFFDSSRHKDGDIVRVVWHWWNGELAKMKINMIYLVKDKFYQVHGAGSQNRH